MVTINPKKQSALIINEEKIRLEAAAISKINTVFRNMAQDSENLYKTTEGIPYEELAQNYYPEFLKEIRDAMRRSIKFFGFSLRKTLEEKHGLFFDAEFKEKFIDVEYKKNIRIVDDNIDAKLEQINNNFSSQATFFIANQAESQASFITSTNAKQLAKVTAQEEALFAESLARRQREVSDITNSLAIVSDPIQAEITRRKISDATRQLAASSANARSIIAKNIKINLLEKRQVRSELIASQNIGLAESWSRQTEAELIHDAGLISSGGGVVKVIKTWVAILDGKTRSSHAEADHQQVEINDSFVVGGESLKYPRAPEGSARNTINCRCISNQEVETN